jgi:hypothetical protein
VAARHLPGHPGEGGGELLSPSARRLNTSCTRLTVCSHVSAREQVVEYYESTVKSCNAEFQIPAVIKVRLTTICHRAVQRGRPCTWNLTPSQQRRRKHSEAMVLGDGGGGGGTGGLLFALFLSLYASVLTALCSLDWPCGVGLAEACHSKCTRQAVMRLARCPALCPRECYAPAPSGCGCVPRRQSVQNTLPGALATVLEQPSF